MEKTAKNVSAQIMPIAGGLRVINVKEKEEIYLPSTFQIPIDGTPKEFAFLDSYGQPAPFVIPSMVSFDLSNEIDKINFNSLKLFVAAFGHQFPKKIVFNDPYEEADAEEQLANRSMQVFRVLEENKDDTTWLTKVFRRVTGLATSGITPKMAFNRLFETAKNDPEKFFAGNVAVWEDTDFEYKSMIDVALERGGLARDGNFIKYPDGKMLAKDYDEAVFFIRSDRQLRDYIMRGIETPTPIPIPVSQGVVLPENMRALAQQLGKPVETATAVNADGSIQNEADPDKQMEAAIQALTKEGLILNNGSKGFGLKYRLKEMEDDKWLKLSDLVGYFKVNTSEYERYKAMLG